MSELNPTTVKQLLADMFDGLAHSVNLGAFLRSWVINAYRTPFRPSEEYAVRVNVVSLDPHNPSQVDIDQMLSKWFREGDHLLYLHNIVCIYMHMYQDTGISEQKQKALQMLGCLTGAAAPLEPR